jgi:hypothetical protein
MLKSPQNGQYLQTISDYRVEVEVITCLIDKNSSRVVVVVVVVHNRRRCRSRDDLSSPVP